MVAHFNARQLSLVAFSSVPTAEIRFTNLPARLPTLAFKSTIETGGPPLWDDFDAPVGEGVEIAPN